jgi:hypothetical protein
MNPHEMYALFAQFLAAPVLISNDSGREFA